MSHGVDINLQYLLCTTVIGMTTLAVKEYILHLCLVLVLALVSREATCRSYAAVTEVFASLIGSWTGGN